MHLSIIAASLLTLVSCGEELPSLNLNEPIPNGTIVAQGVFTGQSGQAASGSATIYRLLSGQYVLHLSGVSFPQEMGLQLIIVTDSTNLPPRILRSSLGNQNYYFSLGEEDPVFQQVRIYSILQFRDYAVALFVHSILISRETSSHSDIRQVP